MDLGGTTTFMCNLAGELLRRKIPAAVFSLSLDHPLASDFQRQQIPVYCEDERRHIFEDRLTSILRRLATFRPTAVIANLSASSFEALRYVPPGVLRVGTVQSADPGWYGMMPIYRDHLDLIAAVSETIEAHFRGVPELAAVPVRYLPYGVPMPPPKPPAAAVAHQPLRILYLGRIAQEQKRVRLFPIILKKLQESGIPFRWTIAGAGPERAMLEATMRTNHPEQVVTFPGQVAYADVPALLAQHDVFLLASDYEGLPLSLLEAMGQGLVPVVSDLPSGISTVVDESNGFRVALDNTAGYAEAIVRLHHHREELSILSRNAAARVRRDYSVAAMTDRWLAALPPQAHSASTWPQHFSIKPILAAQDPWRFSPPVRWLRRTLIKFRKPGA
jgi:glycosyltransferase involved in cell wall biosynthesis